MAIVRIPVLLAFLLVFLAFTAPAEPIRVTSWNLQGRAGDAGSPINSVPLQLAATALNKLAPDIILLQQIPDWQMCAQLAQALQPAEYRVLICSSFGGSQVAGAQQVAILAKQKAYFSWSDTWHAQGGPIPPGGFAFAAIHLGTRRVGIFSTELVAPAVQPATAQAACVRQLLDQVASVEDWVTNRVETFIIAGSLGFLQKDLPNRQSSPSSLLEQARFFDASQDVPAAQRITLSPEAGELATITDYLFAQRPVLASNPQTRPTSFSRHYPVTCDLELDLASIAAEVGRGIPTATAQPLAEVGHEVPLAPLRPQTEAGPGVATAPVPASVASPSPVSKTPANSTPPLPFYAHLYFPAAILAVGLTCSMLLWLLIKRKSPPTHPAPAMVAGNFTGTAALPSYTVVVAPPPDGSAPSAPQLWTTSVPPVTSAPLQSPGATSEWEAWQQRALAAEQQAQRANALVEQGLIPHLREWLKRKLVRRLLADRTKLLDNQQTATLKALAVDERLARIEAQIREQNQAYERRIEELNQELLAAKEENRELIRAKISQVKAEMEAVRARMLAQARDPGSDR